MRSAAGQGTATLMCTLLLLSTTGCAMFRHGHKNTPKCHEPPISSDVKNMPPLRVPAGLDAPDTRLAIKVPALPEAVVARSAADPCLSDPPSFGAQLAPYTGPSTHTAGSFGWHINGGAARTLGKTADYLGNGWTIGGGFTYQRRAQSRFALQLDLGYTDFNATRYLVNLGQQKVQYSVDGGNGKIWSLTAAGKYTVPFSPNVSGYGLLGIGGYHQTLELTETALYGGIVCDPWGYCYVASTTGDIVVASKTLNKLGWDFGLGLEFPLKGGSAWYLETRYHHVQGNTKSVEYLPLQLGYRF